MIKIICDRCVSRMKRIKQMFRKHWNCLPWLICGVQAAADGDIKMWQYILAVFTIIMLIWWKLPLEKGD